LLSVDLDEDKAGTEQLLVDLGCGDTDDDDEVHDVLRQAWDDGAADFISDWDPRVVEFHIERY
jgi:hypothetical protein